MARGQGRPAAALAGQIPAASLASAALSWLPPPPRGEDGEGDPPGGWGVGGTTSFLGRSEHRSLQPGKKLWQHRPDPGSRQRHAGGYRGLEGDPSQRSNP